MTTSSENTSGSTPALTVWPILRAHDCHALIDFLVDTVGFRTVAVYGDQNRVEHAELAWPDGGGVMLGSHSDGPWSTKPGTAGMYVVTDQVDALYERVKAAGTEIIMERSDQDYGNREFALRDPEGNLWSFGVYRGAPIPPAG